MVVHQTEPRFGPRDYRNDSLLIVISGDVVGDIEEK
jgi:hypothetical protein